MTLKQREDAEVTLPGAGTDFHSGFQLASLLSQRTSVFKNDVPVKKPDCYLGIQVSALPTHHMDIMQCAVGLSDEVTG